ncbi:flagella synthesis protein FlgN [Massilia sp. YIM B02443]|uniref:flagella synthesis protein FlgN n=1 Tax=Massilia sp. YIM B02443 TaxID=3050127 RepID=UPI0025B67370|nr:flagellar protein FlgN [Massilia sp. YIM B02443]MDN4035740.1 flagellar protein FlgN [Massilia sp. YIM B02443]
MISSPTQTLAAEHQHLNALVALMKQEQQMLVALDADALAGLTPQKNALVAELAALSRQRHGALAAAGCEGSEAGMEPWLAVGGNGAARSQWEGMLATAREAKELNRVNGMLINRQLAHNQGVLNAMRTPTNAPAGAIYGASGQTVGVGASKRFVVG